MTYTESKTKTSPFIIRLVTVYKKIALDHFDVLRNDKTIGTPFELFGSEKEKHIKRIFNKYITIQEHMEKLEKTPIFFQTPELIPIFKKKGIEEMEFYQYVFENFIIRITSALDLCGKLGDEVFQLNIQEKYCNWYAFANHKTMMGSASSKILNDFADYLDKTKDHRHLIIHKGGFESEEIKSIDSTIYGLDEVVPLTEPLKEWYDKRKEDEMKKQIDNINDKIAKSIDFISDFVSTLDKNLRNINQIYNQS
jgi:hypothetical protein